MMTALVAALAIWTPQPWAVVVKIESRGHLAKSCRTYDYCVGKRAVARFVTEHNETGYGIKNLTERKLKIVWTAS